MDLDLDTLLDSDTEEVTAAEILESMEEIWINEKFAPEILPNKMEIVECLYLQIKEMEKNIERLEKGDIRRCMHELELVRIRFLVSSYLRARLLKIETYAQNILDQEEARKANGGELYLTDSENTFALSIKSLMGNYITDLLNFMPDYVPDESKEHPVTPNLHSFVFFQSKRAVNGIVVDDGNNGENVVDCHEGSKMIMSYSSISNLLKNNEVKLI